MVKRKSPDSPENLIVPRKKHCKPYKKAWPQDQNVRTTACCEQFRVESPISDVDEMIGRDFETKTAGQSSQNLPRESASCLQNVPNDLQNIPQDPKMFLQNHLPTLDDTQTEPINLSKSAYLGHEMASKSGSANFRFNLEKPHQLSFQNRQSNCKNAEPNFENGQSNLENAESNFENDEQSSEMNSENNTVEETMSENSSGTELNGTKKVRKKRNPLDYVNKTYKGINKIELEQKKHEKKMMLVNSDDRKVTRKMMEQILAREMEHKHEVQRISKPKEVKKMKERFVEREIKTTFRKGQLVWGFLQGWWPALIIDPEEAGMVASNTEDHYVYWIGDNQISELTRKKIAPFSEHLKILTQVLSTLKQTSKKYQACKTVIGMLSDKFLIPKTKPYSQWIEQHFGVNSKHKLDQVEYYPYPNIIKKNLNQLKVINAPKNSKLLDLVKKGSSVEPISPAEPSFPEESSSSAEFSFSSIEPVSSPAKSLSSLAEPSSSLAKRSTQVELPKLSTSYFLKQQDTSIHKAGTVVWAKMGGQKWWPGVIIDFRDGCMKKPKNGYEWVMWYAEYKISEIPVEFIKPFPDGFQLLLDYCLTIKDYLCRIVKGKLDKNTEDKYKMYLNPILEATKDYFSRKGDQIKHLTLKEVVKRLLSENADQMLDDLLFYKYSDIVKERLEMKKMSNNMVDSRTGDIEKSDCLKDVVSKVIPMSKMCLICLQKIKGPIAEHPVFVGNVCKPCLEEEYLPTIDTYENDGKYYCCCLCGTIGSTISCSSEACALVYCKGCLRHLICQTTYDYIYDQHYWNCFVCEDQEIEGIVKPRPDWRTKIKLLFESYSNATSEPSAQ